MCPAEHGFDAHVDKLELDQLVLALGATLHYFGPPGVKVNALMMRSFKDTVTLRKRLIAAPAADSDSAMNSKGEWNAQVCD